MTRRRQAYVRSLRGWSPPAPTPLTPAERVIAVTCSRKPRGKRGCRLCSGDGVLNKTAGNGERMQVHCPDCRG